MNKQTEALKMAVEALQNIDNWLPTIGQRGLRDYEAEALQACKEAIASNEADQMKIGCVQHDCEECQKRKDWVSLSDDERKNLWKDYDLSVCEYGVAIEQALKEKNYGMESC